MSIAIRLRTRLHGQLVAKDVFGNRYYRRKNYRGHWKKEPRWVLYKGLPEASKVPPLWFGWLHHATEFPETATKMTHPWEKPHLPNLTGTPYAFNPSKSPSITRRFFPYKAWTPRRNESIVNHATKDDV